MIMLIITSSSSTAKGEEISMIEMRRQINGKIYDTTTAEFIATIAHRGGPNDFSHECTQLFKTKKGAFFLAGYGGPMSRWKRRASDENGWLDGEGLTPITMLEARNLV